LGEVVDYDGKRLKQAVRQLVHPERQRAIGEAAAWIGKSFSAEGCADWLWRSLAAGQPCDDRFESVFRRRPGDYACYFDDSPPEGVHWSFHSTWKMLRRLRQQGLRPQLIVDVGSSTGVWSATAASIFPDARFVLVDPLLSRYDEGARRHYQSKMKCQAFETALSDHVGRMELLVSNDLYGSSLLSVGADTRTFHPVSVDVTTLDALARRYRLSGRALLKIDVQFAEHLVIAGGREFIREHVDAMILELTLQREHPQAKTYREMLDVMQSLGYELLDEIEGWRDPASGRLQQKDAVFVRSESLAVARAA
jgi:FkbM family methyltransferase